MKLLLVEDEKSLSDAVCQALLHERYEVHAAYDGEEGLDEALSRIYDIILLDIMLPKCDGITILRQLRSAGIDAPVLLLTAKGTLSDKVTGLDSGADDYLVKPFAMEELLARLRAMGRRKGELISDNTLKAGDLSLNLSTYELCCGGQQIKLSKKEADILRCFFLNLHTIIKKDDLLAKLWGYDSTVTANNLEVYVSFLRKKLAYLNSGTKITCIRNVGYRLEEKECSET